MWASDTKPKQTSTTGVIWRHAWRLHGPRDQGARTHGRKPCFAPGSACFTTGSSLQTHFRRNATTRQFFGKQGIEDALHRLNAKMVYVKMKPVELVTDLKHHIGNYSITALHALPHTEVPLCLGASSPRSESRRLRLPFLTPTG